jgi:hypothetical protein
MRYLRVEPNSELKAYDGPRPFRAVVIVEEPVSPEWQLSVSKWLVEAGCLYMLAWGRDCSSWDDSVDLANLQALDFGDIPDQEHVMTTWHEEDSLVEVFQFAKHHANAMSPDVAIVDTLIFHVGSVDRGREYGELFAAA